MPAAPHLNAAEPLAVFLDFDGTIVEIAEQPELVQVPERLLATIQAVHDRLDGALALISGRSIEDLDRLLAPLRLPLAGVHGSQHRDRSGQIQRSDAAPIPPAVRKLMRELKDTNPALILEDKGNSLALHYRQSPSSEALIRSELQAIFSDLGQDFILQDGKMVLEVRPAGASKGTAIHRFMEDLPFRGRRPAFFGDDITDEDAFRAINDMGGYSVRVGSDGSKTAARFHLPDVEAVRDWLGSLARPD